MKSTRIEYQKDSNIFLLDNFFHADLVENILKLFDNINNSDWESSKTFQHQSGRLMYKGNNTAIDQITQFASSSDITIELSKLINSTVEFDSVSLWADIEGYEITPHTDPDYFQHAVQIYVTRDQCYWNSPMMGTTIYSAQQQALLQLPYRNNFGYFFETPNRVVHGLGTTVPAGMQRNSVYLRYNKK